MVQPSSVRNRGRRFIVPEVVQISNMDCGPASLKCVADGFGLNVSYGRLREACQTDRDGTSIDTIEDMAVQLGLLAEQVLLPADYLSLPEGRCLPAIVVVQLPTGATHFIVVWRRHGRFFQIMDPSGGRRWISVQRLLDDVYEHVHAVRAASWRDWAGSDEFLRVLRGRLLSLGAGSRAGELIDAARSDPGWPTFAALDAATRMTEATVRTAGLRRGRDALHVLEAVFERARREPIEPDAESKVIPARYWSVRPVRGPDDREWLAVRGAVMLRFAGRADVATAAQRPAAPSGLEDAIDSTRRGPLVRLVGLLRDDGVLAPLPIALALATASSGVIVEGLVLRSLLDASRLLGFGSERLLVLGALISYAAILVMLDLPIAAAGYRAGRALELRLRIAFLDKVTRLVDRYFQSRLISDMVERCHSLHLLRAFPPMAMQLCRSGLTVALLTGGIVWLHPAGVVPVLIVAAVAVGAPLAAQAMLAERDLRVRTHAAALSRFYLDGMLGLLAIRACGAERILRREHEGAVTEWVRAGLHLQRAAVAVELIGAATTYGTIAWMLFGLFVHSPPGGSLLLLVYWILSLPAAAQEFASIALQYPAARNTAQRVFEPLDSPETTRPTLPRGRGASSDRAAPPPKRAACAIVFDRVAVRVAGHTILEDFSLSIPAGAHVAIVGPSGAGKTTVLGLLLGWHVASRGHILVDGEPLTEESVEPLRTATAWVDPTIQIWNDSLLGNLSYGNHGESVPSVARALVDADLESVVAALPNGLQSSLGENGANVSAGEAQRVRLGRALLRPGVRLALLDEPLRGLDRVQRNRLLDAARQRWKGATLLCVTHDAAEAQRFDRVVVLVGGRIVQDGPPEALLAADESWFRAMFDDQEALRQALDAGTTWRHGRMSGGRVVGPSGSEAPS
ncbi:MAG: ATP-binding cassette domain-containing protein [Phycisphaerae bacterium]|nr:ATP-binding cassette domain-containing protein [Phycisphaerae bacterium]